MMFFAINEELSYLKLFLVVRLPELSAVRSFDRIKNLFYKLITRIIILPDLPNVV